MAEFSTLQSQVRQTRAELESHKRQIFLTGERIKRLELEKQRIARGEGTRSDAFQALAREQDELRQTTLAQRARLEEASTRAQGLIDAFGEFTDPRTNLARLSDSYPILLLPVRIETRFKTLDDGGGEPRHQLWVRVFPDECSIDTFDDVLSVSEVTRRGSCCWVFRATTPSPSSISSARPSPTR
jgi:hypothetical protein